jgi:hypothetical protein
LVGTTGQTEFTDQPVLNFGGWVNTYVEPDTKYYYRIVPVSPGNISGPASELIESKTLASNQNNLAPNKVLGLHVVHVSPITTDNYLCLFFYTNIESDVNRYRIYRSRETGFRPAEKDLIGEINVDQKIRHTTPHGFNSVERRLSEFIQQMYADESIEPNTQYFYRVCAVDKAGKSGEYSDEVSGKAALSSLVIQGNRVFYSEGSEVTIQPAFSDGSEVHFTLDGSVPTRSSSLYSGPFSLSRATKVRAAVFYPNSERADAKAEALFSTALYPAPKYNSPYVSRWSGSGIYNLIDGQRGEFYSDGFWQGFEFVDLDVVIDLGKSTEITEVSLGALQFLPSWIFLPVNVDFYVSTDGINFKPAGQAPGDPALERTDDAIRQYTVKFEKQIIRYVRVVAQNKGICPEWHLGAGGKAWIFADELTVK